MKLIKHRYAEVISEECRSRNYVYQKIDVYKVYYIDGISFQFWKLEMKMLKYYCIRTGATGNAMYGGGGFTLHDAYRCIIYLTKKRLENKYDSAKQ